MRWSGTGRRCIRRSNRAFWPGDTVQDNAEAQQHYARSDQLKQQISNLNHELERLEVRSEDLLIEQKKIGPSLKEVRFKIRKEWIPVWLEDPHAYRPTTKMPAFRLDEGQRRAIAAFVWQAGVEGELSSQPRGNAVRGKELFETRGCMGCHAVGDGEEAQGSSFAANLSRVGEKVHYDYLVPWIHNPQERQPLSVMPSLRLRPGGNSRHCQLSGDPQTGGRFLSPGRLPGRSRAPERRSHVGQALRLRGLPRNRRL